MDPETKAKLEETFKLVEENNKIIKQLRTHLWIGRGIRIVYWVVIIGIALSAYYFAQPFVEDAKGIYGGAKEDINSLNSIIDNFR